jgi:hypothetical protein
VKKGRTIANVAVYVGDDSGDYRLCRRRFFLEDVYLTVGN